MPRHERDAVSLMGGLLLVPVALGFLLDDLAGVRVDAAWAVPGALVLLGVAGLAATLRRGTRT